MFSLSPSKAVSISTLSSSSWLPPKTIMRPNSQMERKRPLRKRHLGRGHLGKRPLRKRHLGRGPPGEEAPEEEAPGEGAPWGRGP
ncbi:unnamed protein product [Arctogadus glacialis]